MARGRVREVEGDPCVVACFRCGGEVMTVRPKAGVAGHARCERCGCDLRIFLDMGTERRKAPAVDPSDNNWTRSA